MHLPAGYSNPADSDSSAQDRLVREGSPAEEDPTMWDALDPRNIPENVDRMRGRDPNETIARASYEEADESFRVGTSNASEDSREQLSDAAEMFEGAAQRWPDSSLEEEALFMAGESHFFNDRYPEAAEAYEKLIEKYPRTQHLERVDARRFAIAQYWLGLYEEDPHWVTTPNLTDSHQPLFDTFGHAVRLLEKIRLDNPTGDLADDATMALGNAFLQKKSFTRAEEFYHDLRRTYPHSEHQFEAHLLGLQCKMQIYQGPDYDGGDLEESETLIVHMRRLFPDQAREQQEYLDRALREIRLKLAEREWAFAKYYDNRHEYVAAQMHYELVAANYSDTNLAKDAEERLAELKDVPADSGKRMAWLPSWIQ